MKNHSREIGLMIEQNPNKDHDIADHMMIVGDLFEDWRECVDLNDLSEENFTVFSQLQG